MKRNTALTIAGRNRLGGAGIQADFIRMPMNGVCVIRAVIARIASDTAGVNEMQESHPDWM